MLIHMDSFDVYAQNSDLSFQYTILGGINIGTTSGRFGQGSLNYSYYGSSIQRNFNRSYTDIWTGFAIKTTDPGGTGYGLHPPYGNSDNTVIGFASNSGQEGWVTFNNFLGVWKFWIYLGGNNTSLQAYAVANTLVNDWHWIDIHYVPNTGSGTFEFWLDGTQLINFTGRPTSVYTNNITAVWLGGPQQYQFQSCLDTAWDDWYILDSTTGPYNTTRLGDSRIYTLVPNGDAGPNDGVPSTSGPHYAMVKEPQNDGLTTYVTIQGISGQEELYTMSSLPTQPSTIYGTRVLNIVEQTAGGVLNANAVIVSNGVESQGNSQPILNVFFSQFGIFESDPSTNEPWTYSNINLAECGFLIV